MKSLYLCLTALALAACASEPPSQLLLPADPSIALRHQSQSRVDAGSRHYEVVEPLDWQELNRRVGPKEKQP
jgi:uncharacterized lipoprotein YmbA